MRDDVYDLPIVIVLILILALVIAGFILDPLVGLVLASFAFAVVLESLIWNT